MNALVGATDSYTGSSVITLLMAVDPTGTLLKFAQILKIINKIRFFNINFGSKLGSFLKAVGDIFKFLGPQDQRMDVEAAVGYRGALSKNYVDLQFGLIFPEKIPIYLLSWILLSTFMIIRKKKYELPKWSLYIMHFHP